MKKNILIITVLAIAILAVFYSYQNLTSKDVVSAPVVTSEFDGKNATYVVEGKSVTLVNGEAKVEAAPGSASKVTTRYFGNEAKGDLNKDGRDDIAFLITQDGGGSGLFYYAVVALKTDDGYKLTNTFKVGDRIAPQNNVINSAAELNINYAERRPGEPMTTPPSSGAVLLLRVTPDGKLVGLMS